MGSSTSTEQSDTSYNNKCHDLSIDTNVIKKIIPYVLNVEQHEDDKYTKSFLVRQLVNNISFVYRIDIKIIDINIFVYLGRVDKKDMTLVHVGIIEYEKLIDVSIILKLIQISSDFDVISLPDGANIAVYDL